MIRIRDIEVRFGAVCALRLGSLEIAKGERVAIEGPNGSGKSTLLRVIAGLQRPTTGSVEGAPRPGHTVLVHQTPYFFRGTARDNVAYALRRRGRPRSEADEWLERVDAAHLADRRGKALSVGERRRVAIVRALAAEPEVLLLDEPFAALDSAGLTAVQAIIAEYTGTLVVAAPDLADANLERMVTLAAPV